MPEMAGADRGPLCTSGIEDLRTGPFRAPQAAFRFSIHNDGWGWATGGTLYRSRSPGRHGEPLRPRAARGAGRPGLAPGAARLHDRGPARGEQPRHASIRSSPTSSATRARSSPSASRNTRSRRAAFAPAPLAAHLPAARRRGPHGLRPVPPTAMSTTRARPTSCAAAITGPGTHLMGASAHDSVVDAPAALLGPRQPLPRRRRQHAERRHGEHDADARRALLPQRRAHRQRHQTGRGPDPGRRRGSDGMSLHHISDIDELQRAPARGDAARTRDDPALSDGAVLDPAGDELGRLPRHPGGRGRGDAAPDAGGEHPQRRRRRTGPDAVRASCRATRPILPDGETDFQVDLPALLEGGDRDASSRSSARPSAAGEGGRPSRASAPRTAVARAPRASTTTPRSTSTASANSTRPSSRASTRLHARAWRRAFLRRPAPGRSRRTTTIPAAARSSPSPIWPRPRPAIELISEQGEGSSDAIFDRRGRDRALLPVSAAAARPLLPARRRARAAQRRAGRGRLGRGLSRQDERAARRLSRGLRAAAAGAEAFNRDATSSSSTC